MFFGRRDNIESMQRRAGRLVPQRGVHRRAAGHVVHALVLYAAVEHHAHAGLGAEALHAHVDRRDPAVALHRVVAAPDENRVNVLQRGLLQPLAAALPADDGGGLGQHALFVHFVEGGHEKVNEVGPARG